MLKHSFMSLSAGDVYFLTFFSFLRVKLREKEPPGHFRGGFPGRILPRGLMVLSSVSLSLLDFPLDIRAAMENALARDESCGFGDDVYSMSVGTKQTKIFHWRPKKSSRCSSSSSSRCVLRAQSQTEPCGSLVGRMSDGTGSRGCGASCGLRSEDLLLFGKLQPSSYNSWNPPIRASAPRHGPTVPRGSDTEQPMRGRLKCHTCVCVRVCDFMHSLPEPH